MTLKSIHVGLLHCHKIFSTNFTEKEMLDIQASGKTSMGWPPIKILLNGYIRGFSIQFALSPYEQHRAAIKRFHGIIFLANFLISLHVFPSLVFFFFRWKLSSMCFSAFNIFCYPVNSNAKPFFYSLNYFLNVPHPISLDFLFLLQFLINLNLSRVWTYNS